MKRVLTLARKGMGCTRPNPMVGAVVVKNDQILAEGYHQCYGGPHAEILALGNLTAEQTAGATLYVNLEPCCHHGKTPPCVGPILQSRIRRIVIGIIDPNPLVNGRSIQQFSEHGIDVELGVMEDKCRELNKGYLKHITTGLPWVTVKIAQTLDGKIADSRGSARWITGQACRKAVHRLRASHDAILVGVTTVQRDDPQLTVRHVKGHQPQRVVLDARLETPIGASLLDTKGSGAPWIITGKNADGKRKSALEAAGAKVLIVPDDREPFQWEHILEILGKNGITSVLVEGGSAVFTGILRENAADRIIVNIAPKLLGDDSLPAVGDLQISSLEKAHQYHITKHKRLGDDLWVELEPLKSR